jgi:hypothetical protein
MASLNKVQIIDAYISGASIPDVSSLTGVPRSTVRGYLKEAGVLRARADGVRLARHKLGSGNRGKKVLFSKERCAAISNGRKAWADKKAVGVSLKASGYVEYTRGPNKGRSVHVVTMEARLGRRLLPDEVVHHIDGNRSNNDIDNLALMTRAAHARLHRREDALSNGAL